MKPLISVLPLFFLFFSLGAQPESPPKIPKLTKMKIGTSGCAAYFPEGMPAFELTKSEDGSDVYTAETVVDDFFFSCITVKFLQPFSDASPEEMEELLVSYLDFLEDEFDILSSAGVGKGHRMDDSPDVRGVLDYWADTEDTQYAVKGWVNQRALGVMILYGPSEYPHFNVQKMYLDGFRFEE